MKFTTEESENRRLALTIEVEPERVKAEMQKAAHRLASKGRIPGYRKGRAPYAVVARHYGERAIFEEMVDEFAATAVGEALAETGIEPYAPIELVGVKQEPFAIKVSIPLPPKVDLGNYREIRKEFPHVSVSDEQVDEFLERIRKGHGSWAPVERLAEKGDMVFVTFQGTVDGQVAFNESEDFPLIVGETYGEPLPGFSEKLAGAKAGDELRFALTVPEDYPQAKLAGKGCEFQVQVLSVRALEVPPLDDDLAKMVGDFENLDALRAKVRETLLDESMRKAEREFALDVLDMIVAQSTIQYPLIALEEELDRMMENIEAQLRRQGQDLDSYLELAGQTREDFRAGLKPRAEQILRRSLVLDEITRREKINVNAEELIEAYTQMAEACRRVGLSEDWVRDEGMLKRIFKDSITKKTLTRVREIATGQAPELPEADAAPAEEH